MCNNYASPYQDYAYNPVNSFDNNAQCWGYWNDNSTDAAYRNGYRDGYNDGISRRRERCCRNFWY